MRIGSLVLGILGGLVSGMLGAKWLSDASQYAEQLELAKQLGIDTGSMVTAGWLLVLAFVAGIVGAVQAARHKGKHAAAIMITAGVLPAAFEMKSLVGTTLLIIGGFLALGVKPR